MRFLKNQNTSASESENYKTIEILLESQNKEEALEKIIEKKLTGIFYGDPLKAFVNGDKDGKLKLQLRIKGLSSGVEPDFFTTCQDKLPLYKEILGRRNAIVHNAGIVDSKYEREIDAGLSTKLEINQKVIIDETYLNEALSILDFLATIYIQQVCRGLGLQERPKSAKLGIDINGRNF